MPILTLQGLTMSVLCALMLAYCVCTTIHRIRTQRPPDEALSKRKPDPEMLGILYQTGQQNLVSFKESQWSITNYSLLAIAALVAVFTIAWDSHFLVDFLKYTAVVLVVAIAGFGAVPSNRLAAWDQSSPCFNQPDEEGPFPTADAWISRLDSGDNRSRQEVLPKSRVACSLLRIDLIGTALCRCSHSDQGSCSIAAAVKKSQHNNALESTARWPAVESRWVYPA